MSEPDVAHRDEQAGEPSRDDNSPIRLLVLSLAVGGAYYVGALIGFALTFPDDAVSTLWPPNAILLASLLLTPTRTWWAIFLGVLPAHFAVQLQTSVPILMILCWFISNSAEALISAFCVRHFIQRPLRFDSFRHVAIFATFAVLFSPFVTSFLDAGFVVLNQWRQVEFWGVWQMRFPANALAALTLVPAIVLWMTDGVARLRRASLLRCLEGGLLISGVLIVSYLVFGWQSAGPNTLPALVYLPMPLLLWAAVRFGPLGSSTCVLLVVLLSIWGTIHGRGPFISSSPAENVFFLQLFLIVVSVPLFFLVALLEERRRAAQTRAQAAAIVESSNDAIIGGTLDGIITSWNPGAEKLFGYSAAEAIGRPVTILIPSDQENVVARTVAKIKRGEGIQAYETVQVAKGGKPVHVSITLSPVIDASGKIAGVSSITRDITERKRVEAALRESERRLARTEEFSLVMVTQTDLEGRWLKVPPTLCKLLGYTERELLGRHFHELTHPDDIEGNVHQRARLLRGEIKSFDLEKRYLCKDGRIVWVYLNVSVVTDANEAPLYCLSYIRDITKRKQVEETLRESEERLRLALEAGRMGVWDLDKRTNAVSWSKEQFSIMGLAPFSVEPSYEVWTRCLHPDDLSCTVAAMEKAIAERKEYQCEYRVVLPDRAARWVEARGTPIYDERGECVRVRGVVIDVTERKQSEQALREALGEVHQLKLQLEADNIYLREELSETHRFGGMVGESEEIKKVFEQVERVAATDMTVLVLGETGTGKELVARLVHEKSERRQRPLVKVNCSTLPAELIESELFGHERGAFTGAIARQVGRFELADGGTIFLDEVGDLPLKLQAKLLRALQEEEFERLGSGKTIKVDVRVIAATNRNLSEAVQRGRFRADLYYRLNVYPIEIPPLRERGADIGLLAEVFLDEAGRRLGKSFGKIQNEMIEALRAYSWPGNVRELENVIARAAIISTAPRLQLPDGWNKEIQLTNGEPKPTDPAPAHSPVVTTGQEATLEELAKAHILEVLHQTNWRVEGPKGAAMILGLHPNTLRSRMNKLGVRRPAGEAKPTPQSLPEHPRRT